MPETTEYDNENDWMGACVPRMMQDKDMPQEQAVAACMNMWRDKGKATNDGEHLKAGARNNSKDAERLQSIHDLAVENGAECHTEMVDKSIGNALKSVSSTLDELRVANHIVLFGGRDLTAFRYLGNTVPRFKNADGSAGEYFSKSVSLDSDYTALGRIPINWEHGADPDDAGIDGDEIIGYVDWKTARTDEKGIFVERVLNRRKKYIQWLEELINAGLIGSSTEPVQKGIVIGGNGEITRWPLKKDTLTVTPMEPRMMNDNVIAALKALKLEIPSRADDKSNQQVETGQDAQVERSASATPEPIQHKGVEPMELTDEKLQEMLSQAAEFGAKKAIEATEPVRTAGGVITEVKDEADKPFLTIAEQCKAVKAFATTRGQVIDPRLKRLGLGGKAVQGASEGIPTDGGILLEPTLTSTVLKPIHDEGPFTATISRLPVGANSNSGWIRGVDETNRATGSRWGGLRGYRLAEGDTLTKSKPQFRKIEWELKKYGVLVYGTDELLNDAAQFNAIVEQGSREEIAFMVNDDILNGNGVAGAQGVMLSGALISVTRQNANLVDATDIGNMWVRMATRSKSKSVWYVNNEVHPQLDKLAFVSGTTSVLSPYITYGPDGVLRMYGRPVVETEFNAALGTTGDIVLADMSQYLGWEKGDVQYATSIHVEFLTDQEVMRFIYRFDGKTALASALTPYKGTNTTVSPFVCLTTAS